MDGLKKKKFESGTIKGKRKRKRKRKTKEKN